MKPRKLIALAVLLAGSHVAVFLAARQSGTAVAADGGVAEGTAPAGNSSPRDSSAASSHSRAFQKLLDERLSRADFEQARDDLLKDWMTRDLGAVLDLIYGPGGSPTFADIPLRGALDEQIAKQHEEVFRWIREGRFGSGRQKMFTRWYTALNLMERHDLILAALPEATTYEKSWAFAGVIGSGKPEALDQVRTALLGWYRNDPRQADMLQSYGRKKAALAKGDTAALFAGETDPALRSALGEGWADERLGYEPKAERIGELRELPEDARSLALKSLMGYFDDRHLAGVKPVLEEMNRLEMWNDLASDGARQAVLVSAEVRGEQRQLLEVLKGISDGGARAKLFGSAGRGMGLGGWGESSFDAVYEVLPAGSDRDACLAGIVNAMWERGDEGPAKLGFQGIADNGTRDELLGRMPGLAK